MKGDKPILGVVGGFSRNDNGLFIYRPLPFIFDSRVLLFYITGGKTSKFSEESHKTSRFICFMQTSKKQNNNIRGKVIQLNQSRNAYIDIFTKAFLICLV